MSEEVNKEFDEMLEDVMGGDPGTDNHSPETEEAADKSLEAEKPAPEAEETFEPYGDEENFADDSAEEKGTEEKTDGTPEKTDSVPEEKTDDPEKEKAALQEEITNYKKRLHDTQSAMHKATEERNKLQKELDALKNKKAEQPSDGDDDNWFKDDDSDTGNKKTAELESKIEAIEEKQEQYQRDMAVQKWLADAEAFAKDHEDYNHLVNEKLEPLLNEETGDPVILAAYKKWQDKSPAGAYEFARKLFSTEEKLKAASPEKEENEVKPATDPTKGKAGLDRINSAEFAEPKRHHSNMIDEVFG